MLHSAVRVRADDDVVVPNGLFLFNFRRICIHLHLGDQARAAVRTCRLVHILVEYMLIKTVFRYF
jgi:hypothetical protein